MRTTIKFLPLLSLVLFLVVTLTSPIAVSHARPQVGPIELSGEIHGAPYRIIVPANWNGTLLVFAHGYRDKADHTGEVDNRNADLAPSAALIPPLLAQGYALAGSAFKDNGWAIEDGMQDMKDLTVFFRANVAQPDRTILWAASLGTIIGFKSMEQFGGIYDGALCLCGVGAGATRIWDNGLALYLAYDVVFGVPSSWGTVGEVRNDLDFESEVLQPKLFPEVTNPANFVKFEFVRLVAGNPGQGIVPPPGFFPGWVVTDLFFLTEARAELQRRAGGPYVQNLDQNYTLTSSEKAYLSSIGVPSAVVDGWLAQMNARRNIQADPSARNYVKNNTDYNGKIRNPLLTMHTIVDPLVVVANEAAYAELNAASGKDELLFQTYTTGVGHCSFTAPQLLTAVSAIDLWVRTGVRPTAAFFPAVLGFDPFFVPPQLPQP
jgi:hypothetical protein